MLELRHLGGALARPVANAVGHRDARYSVFTSAYPGPAFAAAADLQTALYQRLSPWSGGRALYNFTARPGRPSRRRPGCLRRAHPPPTPALKADWDPQNLFRFAVTLPHGRSAVTV